MSDGNRSGVNWMREKPPEIEDAMSLASVVLPTPGMSVKSTWPPARSAIRHSSTTRSLPTMTSHTEARSRSKTAWISTGLSIRPDCMPPPGMRATDGYLYLTQDATRTAPPVHTPRSRRKRRSGPARNPVCQVQIEPPELRTHEEGQDPSERHEDPEGQGVT